MGFFQGLSRDRTKYYSKKEEGGQRPKETFQNHRNHCSCWTNWDNLSIKRNNDHNGLYHTKSKIDFGVYNDTRTIGEGKVLLYNLEQMSTNYCPWPKSCGSLFLCSPRANNIFYIFKEKGEKATETKCGPQSLKYLVKYYWVFT